MLLKHCKLLAFDYLLQFYGFWESFSKSLHIFKKWMSIYLIRLKFYLTAKWGKKGNFRGSEVALVRSESLSEVSNLERTYYNALSPPPLLLHQRWSTNEEGWCRAAMKYWSIVTRFLWVKFPLIRKKKKCHLLVSCEIKSNIQLRFRALSQMDKNSQEWKSKIGLVNSYTLHNGKARKGGGGGIIEWVVI